MKIADKISNLKVGSTKMIAALKAGNGYMPLAETTILSDGYFKILLPDVVLGYSYLTSPKIICEEIDVSPASLKVAIVDSFWLFDSNETLIGHVFQGTTRLSINGPLGERIVARWYANQNGQVTCSKNCSACGRAVFCELYLKKGWNNVVRHFHSGSEEFMHTNQNINSLNWFMTMSELSHEVL